jgi:hypothetical protein
MPIPWSPDREDGRRCLIGDELPEAGMELDERGRWRIALTDSERDRLQGRGAKGSRRTLQAAQRTPD